MMAASVTPNASMSGRMTFFMLDPNCSAAA
jgi:hypothetical protein